MFKSRAAERPERDTWLALHRRVVLDETAPPPPPEPMEITEVLDSSLNKKSTERAFRVTVADGAVAGDLVADARKGKNQAAPELTLTLVDQTGTVVDSASGTSVTVTAEVTAGDYTWEVSGPSARFSLTVTYLTE